MITCFPIIIFSLLLYLFTLDLLASSSSAGKPRCSIFRTGFRGVFPRVGFRRIHLVCFLVLHFNFFLDISIGLYEGPQDTGMFSRTETKTHNTLGRNNRKERQPLSQKRGIHKMGQSHSLDGQHGTGTAAFHIGGGDDQLSLLQAYQGHNTIFTS
jgi:hypothetical protein